MIFVQKNSSWSQCSILPNAIPNITLAYSVSVNNASGVAYNPNFNLYYIAQAGNASFPLQTFDAAGAPLYQTNTGFDMRGLWWNNNTNQLESNGYNTGGIWAYNLNASGYALNTGTSIFTGMNQPTAQSVGDYNCVDNELWYYNNGTIMKRDRATNALIGTFPLVGIPVGTGNLNNNSIFYTDCAGNEIGLVDYVLLRVYFFDKTTLTYSGYSQLPAGTVVSNSFQASWANGLVWLFDGGPDIWHSFQVLSGFNTNCTVVNCIPPNLVTDDLQVCDPNTADLNNGINASSGAGNASFYASQSDADNAVNAISNIVGTSGIYYVRYEDPADPSCYSTGTIVVTINPIYNQTENINACENSTVTYPDGTSAVITSSTSYTSNLLTVQGCDSIIVTNVTMDPVYSTAESVSVCQGTTYTYPDGFSEVITAGTSHASNLSTVAGCDSIITTNVTMNPVYTLTEDVDVCENSTYTYPDGFSEVITGNTTHISNLSTVAGCDSIITTNVTMSSLPDAGTNGTISFCSDDPSTDLMNVLGGNPDPGGTWSPSLASGNGTFNPSTDPGGVYTYQINNACGSASATVNVTVNPAEDATFAYFTSSFCTSGLNPVPAVTGTPGGTFSISGSGSIDPVSGMVNLAASGAGVYTITYTTNGPCPDTYSVTLTIEAQANASITATGPFCEYDASVFLQAAQSGGTWSGPGVDPTTGEFDPAAAGVGTSTITYTIGGACGDAQSIDIVVYPTPTVSTIGDTSIQLDNSIELTSFSNAGSYSWSPNIWLDCNDCLSPIATPEDNVTYQITVEENGCTASDNVYITVLYDPVIFVPNIFSPNGDGNNDVLYVRGKGVASVTFIVYDRWGERVFESTDMDHGWDGNFRGQPMNPAVFVYYVEAIFKNGSSSTLKGDVTLIR